MFNPKGSVIVNIYIYIIVESHLYLVHLPGDNRIPNSLTPDYLTEMVRLTPIANRGAVSVFPEGERAT